MAWSLGSPVDQDQSKADVVSRIYVSFGGRGGRRSNDASAYSGLILAALMIGHHFSISAF